VRGGHSPSVVNRRSSVISASIVRLQRFFFSRDRRLKIDD